MSNHRLAIVEDNRAYRESLTTMFSYDPSFSVAKAFDNGEDLIAAVADPAAFDLVLMDIDLPGIDGIQTTVRLKAVHPRTKVVVLTVFEEPSRILRAICAGADGYLLKKSTGTQLLEQVMNGGVPMTPGVAKSVLGLLRNPVSPRSAGIDFELSNRETQVLQGLVRDLAYKEIAAELHISIDTVRTYVRSLYKKLQVHSVAAAVGKAIRNGLV